MKKNIFTFVLFLFSLLSSAQESINISGNIDSKAFISSDELPFWMFTNSNGFLSGESNVGVSAFAKAKYGITSSDSLELGGGLFLRDGFQNEVERSDLYLKYTSKWFQITTGSKAREVSRQGLSTINDDILWTGNARAIPGVEISSNKALSIGEHFTARATLAHYRLNDDRNVEKTNIHYKNLTLGWEFTEHSIFNIGLSHYAQWGGITEDGIELPRSFKDYLRVFSGQNAVGIDNPNETINALGNHLGSYKFSYRLEKENNIFEVYHQSLFEDRSGRELNNFPDGVWGLYITPKNYKWLKGILYEYVQTISQSGRPVATTTEFGQQSGGDNYFVNSVYTSGWTYEGTTIGLPFIDGTGVNGRTTNNRSIAHHLGLMGSLGKIDFQTKLTYLENLGTYSRPFPEREKKLLSYLQLQYPTLKYGNFNAFLGADFSNLDNNSAVAVGVGYQYLLK